MDQVTGVASGVESPNCPPSFPFLPDELPTLGVDPVIIIEDSKTTLKDLPRAEVLVWASVCVKCSNIFSVNGLRGPHCYRASRYPGQSDEERLEWIYIDLSLDTVKMFANDAKAAGFSL